MVKRINDANGHLPSANSLLELPAEWLLRMRDNPFYAVIDRRVLEWFADDQTTLPWAGPASAPSGGSETS